MKIYDSSQQSSFFKKPLALAVSTACGLAATTAIVVPMEAQAQVEEVLVTATRRAESVQDIPMSVSVLGETQLEDLNITDMEDYIMMLPNVSYVTLGPGSGNIYIRGISSGGESGLGANPSVAVYLDEQPVTAVGQYLNPHVYDINRIEVLAGPQGTTYGANAQSGAIRIITNQPSTEGFEGGFSFSMGQPKSGDLSHLTEAFVNIPLSDSVALRLTGYSKHQGGFIDNVPGTHTFRQGYIRDGLQACKAAIGTANECWFGHSAERYDELTALAADITVDNSDVAEKNFNDATTVGGRAALAIDLNDSWTLTANAMFQDLESEGVWDHDPTVGDLQVMRLLPDWNDDEWAQYSLKLEGELFGGTLTATYADLERDTQTYADYSLYSDYYVSYGFVQPYYVCYVGYTQQCEDPREQYTNTTAIDRQNYEIRYTSDSSKPLRYMVGVYGVEVDTASDNDWHVLGLNDIPYMAVDAPDIYWTTDFVRSYEETAYFGEVSLDVTEQLTVSASARNFDYKGSLNGFSGTVWWPFGGYGPQGDRPESNYGALGAPEPRVTESNDSVYRISAEYQMSDDAMVYATWGEGYRPGGLNRFCTTRAIDGLGNQGSSNIGCEFLADFLTATEFGFKGSLMDGKLRLNAAAFWQKWDDFQFSRLDTSVSPLTLTYNVGNAESNGVEFDFIAMLAPNWTLSGAASFLDSTLTSDYRQRETSPEPDAAAGTKLPRVPEMKWNLSTRYTFENDYFVQGTYMFTGKSYNTLFDGGTISTQRRTQPSYAVANASIGMEKEDWSAQLYINNLTDERGTVWINAVTWDQRVTINQPRTMGVSFTRNF